MYTLRSLDGITDGIFLGIGLLEMLPHAIEDAAKINIHYLFIYVFLFICIRLIQFANQELQGNTCHSICCPTLSPRQLATPVLFLLSFHALFEGMALGIVTENVFQTILFMSVVAHKGLESMAFANSAYSLIDNKYYVMLVLIFFSMLTPLGCYLGTLILDANIYHEILSCLINTFSSAMFICMGLHCVLTPDNQGRIYHIISVAFGLVLVTGLTWLFHHH